MIFFIFCLTQSAWFVMVTKCVGLKLFDFRKCKGKLTGDDCLPKMKGFNLLITQNGSNIFSLVL